MSLIKLPSSVYQTIITHALSHENEEIMGLLCAEDLESYINIYAAFPFRRTTHQPDRVEIEDDDMISGLVKASVSILICIKTDEISPKSVPFKHNLVVFSV